MPCTAIRLQSRQPWRGVSSQQPHPRSARARWVSSCSGRPFPTLSPLFFVGGRTHSFTPMRSRGLYGPHALPQGNSTELPKSRPRPLPQSPSWGAELP